MDPTPEQRTHEDGPQPTAPTAVVDWYDRRARDFDERYATSRAFRERRRVWIDAIGRYSDPSKRALDLGCGSGALLFELATRNASVLGVDGSPEMLRICREKQARLGLHNVELHAADIGALDCRSEFDLLIASSVLEYVGDLDAALRSLTACLRPGGVLLLSMPNGAAPYRGFERRLHRWTGRPRYVRFLRNVMPLEAMRLRLRDAGFGVVEHAYFACTPMLPGLLRRLLPARLSDTMYLVSARRGAGSGGGNAVSLACGP